MLPTVWRLMSAAAMMSVQALPIAEAAMREKNRTRNSRVLMSDTLVIVESGALVLLALVRGDLCANVVLAVKALGAVTVACHDVVVARGSGALRAAPERERVASDEGRNARSP